MYGIFRLMESAQDVGSNGPGLGKGGGGGGDRATE